MINRFVMRKTECAVRTIDLCIRGRILSCELWIKIWSRSRKEYANGAVNAKVDRRYLVLCILVTLVYSPDTWSSSRIESRGSRFSPSWRPERQAQSLAKVHGDIRWMCNQSLRSNQRLQRQWKLYNWQLTVITTHRNYGALLGGAFTFDTCENWIDDDSLEFHVTCKSCMIVGYKECHVPLCEIQRARETS